MNAPLDMEGLKDRLDGYLGVCAARAEAYWEKMNFSHAKAPGYKVEYGPRYIKVIRFDRDKDGNAVKSASVHSFIERSSGNILKAASWRAPAKHARGNVFEDDFGAASAGVDIYGVRYMK